MSDQPKIRRSRWIWILGIIIVLIFGGWLWVRSLTGGHSTACLVTGRRWVNEFTNGTYAGHLSLGPHQEDLLTRIQFQHRTSVLLVMLHEAGALKVVRQDLPEFLKTCRAFIREIPDQCPRWHALVPESRDATMELFQNTLTRMVETGPAMIDLEQIRATDMFAFLKDKHPKECGLRGH